MKLNTTYIQGFMKTVFCVFNKLYIKRKYIRTSEASFMTKELHKTIMKRPKLRSKFLNSRTLSEGKLIHHKKIFVNIC